MSVARRLALLFLILLGAFAGTTEVALARAHTTYSVTDLGTLGGPFSSALGINEQGHVVGFAARPGDEPGFASAFLWKRGRMIDIGVLPGGTYSEAFDVNGRDQVVGVSGLTGNNSGLPDGHAFLYSRGAMTDLGTLGGSKSTAFAINSRGKVVGNSFLEGDTELRAFRYRDGRMTDLGTLPIADYSSAADINARGTIVGESRHAFRFRHGTMADLGTLGGVVSSALGINERGVIVGGSETGTGAAHAFRYRKGHMTDIGALPGGRFSEAQAINARGRIVGDSTTAGPGEGGPVHAFLYRRGRMVDLNDLLPANSGWVLGFAFDINNRGQIVGDGRHDGEERAFLLTPSRH